MSIYCLHKGIGESVENPDNGEEDDVNTLYGSEGILAKVINCTFSLDVTNCCGAFSILQLHKSMRSENVIGDVMVGLLTFLCIILISIVVYLCVSGGIMGLSRQAM